MGLNVKRCMLVAGGEWGEEVQGWSWQACVCVSCGVLAGQCCLCYCQPVVMRAGGELSKLEHARVLPGLSPESEQENKQHMR